MLDNLGEIGLKPGSIFLAAGLFVVLILFYIGMAFIKKLKVQNQDVTRGIPFIDVSGMGRQGLLSPDEQAKVRAAMSRQIARQNESSLRVPAGMTGELALMAEPEVQALEARARSSTEAPAGQPDNSSLPEPPIPEPVGSKPTSATDDPPAKAAIWPPPIYDPVEAAYQAKVADVVPPPVVDSYTYSPAQVPTSTLPLDVELPQDVQKMAELGLITPAEIENIKQRILLKRSETQL